MRDVQFETILPLEPYEAFGVFTHELAEWWPSAVSWSGQEGLLDIRLQPGNGGALYEIDAYGLRWDWGWVRVWQPPSRVVFSWLISPEPVPEPDAGGSSEVCVTFDPVVAGTRLLLDHRGWEPDTPGAAARDRDDVTIAWSLVLHEFRRYVATTADARSHPAEGG